MGCGSSKDQGVGLPIRRFQAFILSDMSLCLHGSAACGFSDSVASATAVQQQQQHDGNLPSWSVPQWRLDNSSASAAAAPAPQHHLALAAAASALQHCQQQFGIGSSNICTLPH